MTRITSMFELACTNTVVGHLLWRMGSFISPTSLISGEKQSGTSTQGRAELRTVLDFIGKGDVLLVTRVDRLARSIGDLQDIVRTLKAKGASLRATEQPIDTSTAAGKCFLDMLGVFAEFDQPAARASA
jgi:DNA invertase Pin-like site-specific DNA recombinase